MYEDGEDLHQHLANWSGGKRAQVKYSSANTTHITIEVGTQQVQAPCSSDEYRSGGDDEAYEKIPRKRNDVREFIAAIALIGIGVLVAISIYSSVS